MNIKIKLSILAIACASISGGTFAQDAAKKAVAKQSGAQPRMGFFVTSQGPGNGANLGGLAGADKHCQSLAQAAGAGKRTWHAYVSTTADGGAKTVNARDRIGKGPWHNAKGELIARDVDQLHENGNITKQTALTEKGAVVNGRGDKPNMHDILTGSDSHGRAFPAGQDTTCGNWTKSGDGVAQVGHHDRQGLREDVVAKSWNQSHPSRGCSQANLVSTGGAGLFYCFAAK
ncbi:MAG: lectin [Betaproteobacteria bacterium]|nr:lectin [Betaproteobacteria bacterium]